jgi:O-antigen/teichoic acid export membrane protein
MSAPPAPSAAKSLVRGGTYLAVAMIVANAGNFGLNLFLGRVLTPAEFSDANLMVTLSLTLTSLALGLQLVAARFVGTFDQAGHPEKSDRLARTLRGYALGAGLVTGAALAVGSGFWSELFNTASWVPFVILGIGMPFYLMQSVGRGVMQGRLRFRELASSYVVEMIVRLGGGVALVALGFGVTGATIGLSVSFIATSLVVRFLGTSSAGRTGPAVDLGEVRSYAALVSVLLVGQLLTNNSDVFAAKIFFEPTAAGIYAAIALVGRAVFYLAWSVATVVFPVVARRHASGGDTGSLLKGGITAVAVIGFSCALGALLLGGTVLGVILGPAYSELSVPLAAYAATTTLFAIANLVASHELSQGSNIQSRLLLGASVVQVVLLLVWHDSTAQLIQAQFAAMALLLVAMSVRGGIQTFRRRTPIMQERAR